MEVKIAGMPIRKKIIVMAKKLKFVGRKKESKSITNENMELLRARFLHHFLELSVKKGLMLGSKPDKKNSSKR
jgi:hypothetical protein